jgi:hypothetical protein
MKATNWENQRHLVPITFGITGHRDILKEDLKRATETVTKTIKYYRSRFPLSPFVFISPLAQGADSAAAKAAIEADSNLFLQVVFPFSEVDYLPTIETDHQNLFQELKNHPKTIGIITLHNEKPLTKVEIDQAYADVGEFVALHTHLLFAFTNNSERIVQKGGTQEIIKYRERGCTNLLDTKSSNVRSSEQGILYKIKVRRFTDKAYPLPTNNDDQVCITPQINEDVHHENKKARHSVGLLASTPASWLKIKRYQFQGKSLEGDEIAANIEELNTQSEKLIEEYPDTVNQHKYRSGVIRHLTDQLAVKYQSNFSYNIKVIFRFAIFAICLECFEKLFLNVVQEVDYLEYFPLLKYFFVFIVLAFLLLNRYQKNKELYESYRAISEALRTQTHWISAGIDDEPANFFLVSAIGEATWVRRVIRTIWILDFKHKKDWAINPETDQQLTHRHNIHSQKISNQLDQLEENWIDSQVTYFKEKKLKEANGIFDYVKKFIQGNIKSSIIQLELFDGLKKLFFCIFILILAILFLVENYPIIDSLNLSGNIKNILNDFKGSCLLISGLIGLYIHIKLFKQEIKNYRISYAMFNHAKVSYFEIKQLEAFSKDDLSPNILLTPQEVIIKKQNVYRNLGIAALDEASLWYISNIEMELENPKVVNAYS